MKQTVFFLILFLCFSVNAQDKLPEKNEIPESTLAPENASPALPLPEEKFAAITQHAVGKIEYDFKDLIPFNKTIEIRKKERLKVITQKRCIAVFYENTKVQTPADKVSPWKVISGSTRWICPEDKIEKVAVKDTELQIQNGEFFLNGNQLHVLRNTVTFEGKNLELQTLYVNKDKTWLPVENQPDPYDLWKKEEKYPAPIESSQLKMEKPDDPYVTRIFLNVAPIGISGLYNHEWENHLSSYDMETHAFRVGTNFPWRNKSIFTFLEFSEGKSPDSNNNTMGPPPIGSKAIDFESLTLGLGLRHDHVKSSSYYYYLGVTRQEIKFHLHPDVSSYYDGEILYPYNISVGGGYQKIFWAKSWISLMVGFDLKIVQSLSQGKTRYFSQPWPYTDDPNSAITEYVSFIYLGPVFNF